MPRSMGLIEMSNVVIDTIEVKEEVEKPVLSKE
jgi:hypothetical protein